MSKYPLHEKLAAMKEYRRGAQDMLDWLIDGKGFLFCYPEELKEGITQLSPSFLDRPTLMAQFLGIDQDALEREKRAMLEEFRKEAP